MGVGHLKWGNVRQGSPHSVQEEIDVLLRGLRRCGSGKKFLKEVPLGKDARKDLRIPCGRVDALKKELSETGKGELADNIAKIQHQCCVVFQFGNIASRIASGRQSDEIKFAQMELAYGNMRILGVFPDSRFMIYWLQFSSTACAREKVYEDAVSLGVPLRGVFFRIWMGKAYGDEVEMGNVRKYALEHGTPV
jgi:hypothetical protein